MQVSTAEQLTFLPVDFPAKNTHTQDSEKGDEPLAKEMLRVIGECLPSYVVAENVYGFFTIDGGESLRSFCCDLQDLGYEEPQVIDASSDFAGLQTMERHLWIVSKANGKRLKRNEQVQVQRVGQDERKFQRAGQGIGGRWDIRESRFFRVGEGTSRKLDKGGRERLKAICNGFPPQVAFEIFKAIEMTEIKWGGGSNG